MVTDRLSWCIDDYASHVQLRVWVNGARSGVLCFRAEEKDALAVFTRALEAAGATRNRGEGSNV